jgi:hypothetical protein
LPAHGLENGIPRRSSVPLFLSLSLFFFLSYFIPLPLPFFLFLFLFPGSFLHWNFIFNLFPLSLSSPARAVEFSSSTEAGERTNWNKQAQTSTDKKNKNRKTKTESKTPALASANQLEKGSRSGCVLLLQSSLLSPSPPSLFPNFSS